MGPKTKLLSCCLTQKRSNSFHLIEIDTNYTAQMGTHAVLIIKRKLMMPQLYTFEYSSYILSFHFNILVEFSITFKINYMLNNFIQSILKHNEFEFDNISYKYGTVSYSIRCQDVCK